MALQQAYDHFEALATEALAWFEGEISHLRTGRVTPEAVLHLSVEHYGARTPLQGVASVSSTDARTLVISPWDTSAIPAIEKAIVDAQLGAQPIVDGKLIRLSFPMLNEEMREVTVKKLHKIAEDARIRLRRSRDEAIQHMKADKEKGAITEDDFYAGRRELDERIKKANGTIEGLVEKKEEEIRSI